MPAKTHLQIFFATLLCISSFSFAEIVEPWNVGHIHLNGFHYPVVQVHEGDNNGFIACYSSFPEIPAFPIGGGTYIKGFIAMQGQYHGNIFHPEGYADMDISPLYSVPSMMCQDYIPACQSGIQCWANGNTAGFFSALRRAINPL